MNNLLLMLILAQDLSFSGTSLQRTAPVQVYDEGIRQGRVIGFDCRGSGVSCIRDGGYAFIEVTSSGSAGGYDGGKVGQAYAADASVYSQISNVSYSADAAFYANQFIANPSDCIAGQYATSIAANGDLTCLPISKVAEAYMADAAIYAQTAYSADASYQSQFSGTANVAYSADAAYYSTQFIANPSDCGSNQYATTIAANGNLTCAQVAYSQVTGTPTIYNQTIEDEAIPLTQRTNVNFTGSGVTCIDSGGKTVCTISGGGSGSANVVQQTISISGGSGMFSQAVTGQAWVTGTSKVICSPFGTTADGLTPQAVSIASLNVSVSDLSAGVGFNIKVYSPYGLEGTVRIHCTGS